MWASNRGEVDNHFAIGIHDGTINNMSETFNEY